MRPFQWHHATGHPPPGTLPPRTISMKNRGPHPRSSRTRPASKIHSGPPGAAFTPPEPPANANKSHPIALPIHQPVPAAHLEDGVEEVPARYLRRVRRKHEIHVQVIPGQQVDAAALGREHVEVHRGTPVEHLGQREPPLLVVIGLGEAGEQDQAVGLGLGLVGRDGDGHPGRRAGRDPRCAGSCPWPRPRCAARSP